MTQAKLFLTIQTNFPLEFGDPNECLRRLAAFRSAIEQILPDDEAYPILQQIDNAQSLVFAHSEFKHLKQVAAEAFGALSEDPPRGGLEELVRDEPL